jgi:hypothetical protein
MSSLYYRTGWPSELPLAGKELADYEEEMNRKPFMAAQSVD